MTGSHISVVACTGVVCVFGSISGPNSGEREKRDAPDTCELQRCEERTQKKEIEKRRVKKKSDNVPSCPPPFPHFPIRGSQGQVV